MNRFFSKRVRNIKESDSIRYSKKVKELIDDGVPIIKMNIGEPDLFVSPGILTAVSNALQEKKYHYSDVCGEKELRALLSNFYKDMYNVDFDYSYFFVSNGSKQCLYTIFQAFLNEGDEVIIPIPWWVSFPEGVKLAGGTPIFADFKDKNFDLNIIKSLITEKTKAIIVNSPNNPSGYVLGPDEKKSLVDLALENNLLIISDEAYFELSYEGPHQTFYEVHPRSIECVISARSFSKSYSMTGFRVGYIVAKPFFIEVFEKIQGHLSGNVCTFAQYGAIYAILNKEIAHQNQIYYEKKMILALKYFSSLFKIEKPKGGLYLFFSIENYLDKFDDDVDFCLYILNHAHVALLPGSYFGKKNFVRLCFAVSDEELWNAKKLIEDTL